MTDPAARLREQLEILGRQFLGELPDRHRDMVTQWERAQAGEEEGRLGLRTQAHRLAGAAGMYGFPAIGALARELELLVTCAPPGEPLLPSIQAVLEGLREQIQATFRDRGLAAPMPAGEATTPLLLALLPEGSDHDRLGPHLAPFGLAFQVHRTAADLLRVMASRNPQVVLIHDSLLSPGDWDLLAAFQAARREPVPALFLSGMGDLERRLKSLRAGSVAFLSEPVDTFAVLEALDPLLPGQVSEPHRILVVEDDPLQAAHSRAVLESAGMEVETVEDPLAVLGPLVSFRPDLVLMDIHMPGCSGLELGAVIRQQAAYVGIPIVYLSREEGRAFQLSALSLGGDDFLTKPVPPETLVAVVQARARRGRILRGFMVRDSLTGFLNHSAILGQLEVEVARARRHDAPLAFAMIDLDHFKAVNDRHGHGAGDQVLRSLSRLLQQRLRRTDILGRYGGEEFAVILPDTTLASAQTVLDEVRESFAQIAFPFRSGPEHLTFSCGIAPFARFPGGEALAMAADNALYLAKGQGKNRVVAIGAPDDAGSG